MSLSDTICAHVADWSEQVKTAPAGQQLSFSLPVLHLTRARFQELLPLFRPLTMDGEVDVEAMLEDAGTRIVVNVRRAKPTVYRITSGSLGLDLGAGRPDLFLPKGGWR